MLLYGLYAIESRKCDIQQTEIIIDTCNKLRNKSLSLSIASGANNLIDGSLNESRKSFLHRSTEIRQGRSHSTAQLNSNEKYQTNLLQFNDYLRRLREDTSDHQLEHFPHFNSTMRLRKHYENVGHEPKSNAKLNKLKQRRNTFAEAHVIQKLSERDLTQAKPTDNKFRRLRMLMNRNSTSEHVDHFRSLDQAEQSKKDSYSKKILQKRLSSLSSINFDTRLSRLALDMNERPSCRHESIFELADSGAGELNAKTRSSGTINHTRQSNACNLLTINYQKIQNLPSPLIEVLTPNKDSESRSPFAEKASSNVDAETATKEENKRHDDALDLCDKLEKVSVEQKSLKKDNNACLAKSRKSKSWLQTIFKRLKRSKSTDK